MLICIASSSSEPPKQLPEFTAARSLMQKGGSAVCLVCPPECADCEDGVATLHKAWRLNTPTDQLLKTALRGAAGGLPLVAFRCPYGGNDCPPMIEATPEGVRAKNWELRNHSGPYMNALFALLAMLSNGGVKQTNHGTVKPENVIRRKPLHKKQHPMYEYRVLELGLGDEEPIVNLQIPRECAKKRLHAVRGFFRHYKKPLKSGPNKGKTKVFVPAVLRNTEVPTKILVETANLKNPTDRKRLADPWWREQFALAYVDALKVYYKTASPSKVAKAD